MPLSRRETLTALGCEVVAGGLQGEFERALDRIQPNGDVLQSLQDAFHGFQETARILPPHQLIDGMTVTLLFWMGYAAGRVTENETVTARCRRTTPNR